MATNDDLLGLALLGLGVGAVAFAVGSTVSKQKAFREQLTTAMSDRGVGQLVNCELGRNEGGPYWLLTVHHPRLGVQAVVVRLGHLEPYSQEAVAFVLERVARWSLTAP